MKTNNILRELAYTAIIGITLLLSSGCHKEAIQYDSRESITFTADIESTPDATETKTYLETTDWTAYWKSGDKIGISAIPTSGAAEVVNKPFTLSSGEGTKRGTFAEDTQTPATAWPIEEATYLAVYPYNSTATVSGTPKVINLTYPHTQIAMQGATGDFSSGVMVSKVTQTGFPTSFAFKNLFSVIKMTLTGSGTLKRVTFKDLSGKPVSGAYTIAVADGVTPVPVFPDTPADGNAKIIELTLNLTLSSTPQEVYLAVPPRAYTSGFEYTFETATERMTKTMPASRTLKPSKYYTYTDELAFVPDSEIYLSANGTANCYIVTGEGNHSFLAKVIGNGPQGLLPQVTDKQFHTDNVNINPVSAQVLWQDIDDLISNVTLLDGKVLFAASSAKGNAVIAVYDGANGTGNILWSWHIWCTDQPMDQAYKNFAGKEYTLLDRNLGATSANPGTTDAELLATYGLYYQWGRKDPFPGSDSPTPGVEKTLYGALTSISKAETSATNGTIVNTIKNPSTFITADDQDSYDWHWYSEGNETTARRNDNLWGNPYGYSYAATVPYSSDGTADGVIVTPTKTIYDPCPVGYMVAPQDTWTGFTSTGGNTSTSSEFNVSESFNNGWNFNTSAQGSGTTSWYPAAGGRRYYDGYFGNSGNDGDGCYWSSSPRSSDDNAGCLFFYSVIVYPLIGSSRATGFSVRCVATPLN